MTEDELALLLPGMVRIIVDPSWRVIENSLGFGEADGVLRQARSRLFIVPGRVEKNSREAKESRFARSFDDVLAGLEVIDARDHGFMESGRPARSCRASRSATNQ